MNIKHNTSDAYLMAMVVVKKFKYICEHNRMCKASTYLKIPYKICYLSTALLFALNINNHSCKIVEHDKYSDMVNWPSTYSGRLLSL